MGRVIGRQGRTLKMIQSILCVKLSIFQGHDPCTIHIYGTQLAVERATWAIQEIVNGIHPIDVVTQFFGKRRLLTPFSEWTQQLCRNQRDRMASDHLFRFLIDL